MNDMNALVAEPKANESDYPTLQALWRGHEREDWRLRPEIYASVAERGLALGEPLFAYDVLGEALAFRPQDARLKTLRALALARCGAAGKANAILRELYEGGQRDEEIVGILASTHKTLWLETGAAEARALHLRRCAELYVEAYELSGGYWSGINAATFAWLTGDRPRAEKLAGAVRAACLREIEKTGAEDCWLSATLGEAALVLGEIEDAKAWYRRAYGALRGGYGNLAATRRNARLLLSERSLQQSFLSECLPRPHVVVFTGHLVDAPGRASPRFPPAREATVRAKIRERLAERDAKIGFAQAACGSDILFLEAMLERGGEINIVLPSAPENFVKTSVEVAPGNWGERFKTVMRRAKSVIVSSESYIGDVSYAYANLMLFGLAKSHARRIDADVGALAVWDGKPGALGGTASAVEMWSERGQSVSVIDPMTGRVESRTPAQADPALPALQELEEANPYRLVTMLFADAVGFSKLTEEQIPRFVNHFLGLVAELLEAMEHPPLARNVWGDGLYFVFDHVRSAGDLALTMCQAIDRTDWRRHGLPAGLNLRIALHSGPAYPMHNPIVKRLDYMGFHVSRAARIEPVTPPGEVFASQAFAALAEAFGVREFACDYVGQTPLAKNYGVFPTYRVRRLAI
jgi:class 3 adenylate cyclase